LHPAVSDESPPTRVPSLCWCVALAGSYTHGLFLLNHSPPPSFLPCQLEACIRLRKILSIERNPPIAEVIAAGVIPRLVQFLHCFEDPTLAFEAAWALTNVASGTSEHARVIIDNGAVPVFVKLVHCQM